MNILVTLCVFGSVAPDVTTGEYVVIFETEVEIVDVNNGGVPVVFATYMGIGANFDFLNMPLWAQEALIAHELGHINLNHIYDPPKLDRAMYYLMWETVDPRERDADLYASDLIGTDTMIDVLNYARGICIRVEAANCVVETFLRSEMLRKQYCI